METNQEGKRMPKVGLFGGTFNPLHLGHLNSMLAVQKRLHLDRIVAIPASQNPLKVETEGPSGEERLAMVRLGLAEYDDVINVDDQEIRRGGKSYTVDTVTHYAEVYESENLFLILGIDAFADFDQWRDFAKILELTNLIVTTRPGKTLPSTVEDLPEGIKKFVDQFENGFATLTTGRTIEFVRLEDVDVSSSEIRKRIRTGKSADRFLSMEVEKFIQERGLYKVAGERITDYPRFIQDCCSLLASKKGLNIRSFDLRGTEGVGEYSIIASGTSTRHVTSLGENIVSWVKDEYGILPFGVEGLSEGRWVVVDYGTVIIHLFYDFVRQQYKLEELWQKGQEIKLTRVD